MTFYPTRYAALKDHPNAVVRKVRGGDHKGSYIAMYDYFTLQRWKRDGSIR